MSYANADERELLISGLRAMATYLEAHPDAPAPRYVPASVFVSGDCDAEEAAEVERVAEVIGAEIDPVGLKYGHVRTKRYFGPVEYAVVAITRETTARGRALDSYFGCVEPNASEEDDR